MGHSPANCMGTLKQPPTGSVAAAVLLRGPSDPPFCLRRRVLDLIEVVQRAGMTAPWLPIPALVALMCDVHSPATADKALAVLKLVRGFRVRVPKL